MDEGSERHRRKTSNPEKRERTIAIRKGRGREKMKSEIRKAGVWLIRCTNFECTVPQRHFKKRKNAVECQKYLCGGCEAEEWIEKEMRK